MKAKPPTKAHIVFSIAFWVWLALALLAPFLPTNSLSHHVLTYAPPAILCFPTALAIVIILIRFLLRKANKLDRLSFVASLISSFIISGFQIPLSTTAPTGQLIRVLTTNVEFHNRDVPGLREFVRDRKVDIIMMQEVKGGDQSPAIMMQKSLPGGSLATAGEVAILSQWPLSDIKQTPLGSLPGRFILSASVNGPKPFRAMTTHWSVPQVSKGFDGLINTIEKQSQDYEDTAKAVLQESQPIILGGDFNNPPRHGLSRKLSDQMVDAFSSRGFGLGWTYPAKRPMVRIDHLFSNKTIMPISGEVGPSFGSDHRSLFAEFAIE